MNYLPDACNHGAKIFTQTEVHHLERTDTGWAIHYQRLDSGRKRFDAPTDFVEADVVVLAAGTLGSTEILLRSKAAGLAMSDCVGQRFSGNGDVLAFAYNADREINGVGFGARRPSEEEPVGPCITGVVDLRMQPELGEGMVIEDGSIPGAGADLLPELMSAAAKLEGARANAGDAADAAATKRELESILLGPRHGAMRNTQTFLVMTHDAGDGALVLDGERLRVQWPGVAHERIFEHVQRTSRSARMRLAALRSATR